MKISLNTIRNMNARYKSSDDVAAIGVDQLVEKIGAQLGAVEETLLIGDKYQGIIIAKVVSCNKHPNADRLNVCLIDDGGVAKDVERDAEGHVQVVCGAPNVRAGLLVAWLPPGSTVPESVGKEPFVLGARELRGVISNGMLASPKELALGDSHDGILEIDGDHQPGTDFAEVFGLKNDVVIDIENKMFTHRPDCFGYLGVARELAGIQGMPYKSPPWYTPNPYVSEPVGDQLKLTVQNELPNLVPRFTAVVLRDVQVGPSPVWLQVVLAKIGSRSINNVVDYTNFFMQQTGQPLHAYDYDKVKALSGGDGSSANIVIRNPKPSEKLRLLNGKEVTPRSEAIMIATDKELIGMGGVMGGADTEVDSSTKNIILESANFDMYSIRRTSMAHGLFTDAVTRFNKGQSPLQNIAVLAKIVNEIVRYAGGQIASPVIDNNHLEASVLDRNSLYTPVTVSSDFINSRLGLQLSAVEMKTLLENVEFEVSVAQDQITVKAPFWRTDIELREDVVEEIGRLYGFDKLPLVLPKRETAPAKTDQLLTLKAQVRRSLSAAGANELLTYSFVHGKLLENAGQNPEQAFKLSNAISPELQYYRMSLTPSLLEKIHPNLKAGYDQFALFEMGKGHNVLHSDDDEGLPSEFEMLDVVVTAHDKLKPAGAPYYQARKYLDELAADFGIVLTYTPFEHEANIPVAKPYDASRSAVVGLEGTSTSLGIIGEYKTNVRRSFKLPRYTAGFSIDLKELMAAADAAANPYEPLPRFPKVTQDITLKVDTTLSYQKLSDFVASELIKIQSDRVRTALNPIDIYQKQDDLAHKQITLRLSMASYDRTLTDAEVNNILDKVSAAAKQALGAERI